MGPQRQLAFPAVDKDCLPIQAIKERNSGDFPWLSIITRLL
jgi:hypothetical protein